MKFDNMYPNQRTVTVNKEDFDADNLFCKFNLKAIEKARKLLSPNAFKLWSLFGQNADGFTTIVYSVKVMELCGFKKNTYTKTFNELIDLGYLVPSKDNHNHYDFYEMPVITNETRVTVHKASLDELSDIIAG